MNISYKYNKLIKNFENKIILKNLYIKFFVRNKLDNISYVIENGFFFFNVNSIFLKKNIKFKKNDSIGFYKKKKARIILKNFSKKLSIKFNKIKVKIKIKRKFFKKKKLRNTKKYIEKNFNGFSLLVKDTILTHKSYKNFQIYFFLKKRFFINFLKFQLLLIKIFFKILITRTAFIGSIIRIKKGGFICESSLLTIKAFLPRYRFLKLKLHKNIIQFKNFEYFYNDPIEIFSIFYIFCFIKSINILNTLIWNSIFFLKQKILFPLYIYSIKKKFIKKSKKKFKKMFKIKIKKKKKFGNLKKKFFFFKRRYFYKKMRIILSMNKNHFKKKKIRITNSELVVKFNKKCANLIKKIFLI